MLKLRKVQESDKDILLEWRNNPIIYRYSLNPSPVLLSDHERWFNKVINDQNCFFFMGIFDGQMCGTVRYNLLNSKEAEVSISIAPEFQGKGIAKKMMEEAEAALKKESSVEVIHAVVLNENKASMSLFQKSGFEENIIKFIKKI